MMGSTHSAASTFRRLPIFAIGLSYNVQQGTISPVAAKSATEIGVSKLKLEPTHALAWFFVGTRTSFLGAQLAYVVGSLYSVMVVRARASKEALVSFFTSYANLVRAATRRLASFCGSNKLLKKEAAIMATTPTSIASKSFTFLVAQGPGRLSDLRCIRTITAVADTEAQARSELPDLPLVFLSCKPSHKRCRDKSNHAELLAVIASLESIVERIDLSCRDRWFLERDLHNARELLEVGYD